jgi:hypothetical protein
VNVVVPHPLPAALNDPPNLNVGRSSAIVSGVDVSSGELSANENTAAVGAFTTAFPRCSPILTICGSSTAVDAKIGVVEMSIFPENATPADRVFKLALCETAEVVTPVPIVTVHSDCLLSVAVRTVRVSDAVEVPDALGAALNVVVPHPEALGLESDVIANCGSTTLIMSLVAMGTFRAKVNATDVGAEVTGFENTNVL